MGGERMQGGHVRTRLLMCPQRMYLEIRKKQDPFMCLKWRRRPRSSPSRRWRCREDGERCSRCDVSNWGEICFQAGRAAQLRVRATNRLALNWNTWVAAVKKPMHIFFNPDRECFKQCMTHFWHVKEKRRQRLRSPMKPVLWKASEK